MAKGVVVLHLFCEKKKKKKKTKNGGVTVEERMKMIYFALDTIKSLKSLAKIKIKWTKLSNKKYCP